MPDADPLVALPDTDRQYHIDLAPGEVADYILLPGDPERIDRIAERLDAVTLRRQHREFHSVTGIHGGLRVTSISTGIGADNVEIVMAELLAITTQVGRPAPTILRIGSCGVLREDIALGDLIITTGAVRMEATTSFFVEDGFPAVADYMAVAALVEAAARTGHRAHLGITATAPGFYGAQGRPIPQLPLRYPDLAERMAAQGVVNFEMEASAVLVLAALGGCRAGVLCTAFAHRSSGDFVMGDRKTAAEDGLIETGLEALRLLARMDRQREVMGDPYWRPSHWTAEMAT